MPEICKPWGKHKNWILVVGMVMKWNFLANISLSMCVDCHTFMAVVRVGFKFGVGSSVSQSDSCLKATSSWVMRFVFLVFLSVIWGRRFYQMNFIISGSWKCKYQHRSSPDGRNDFIVFIYRQTWHKVKEIVIMVSKNLIKFPQLMHLP